MFSDVVAGDPYSTETQLPLRKILLVFENLIMLMEIISIIKERLNCWKINIPEFMHIYK